MIRQNTRKQNVHQYNVYNIMSTEKISTSPKTIFITKIFTITLQNEQRRRFFTKKPPHHHYQPKNEKLENIHQVHTNKPTYPKTTHPTIITRFIPDINRIATMNTHTHDNTVEPLFTRVRLTRRVRFNYGSR